MGKQRNPPGTKSILVPGTPDPKGTSPDALADRRHLLDHNFQGLQRLARTIVDAGKVLDERVLFVADLRDGIGRTVVEMCGMPTEMVTETLRSAPGIPTVIGDLPIKAAKELFDIDGPRIARLLSQPIANAHFRAVVIASGGTTYAVVPLDCDGFDHQATARPDFSGLWLKGRAGGIIQETMAHGLTIKKLAEVQDLESVIDEIVASAPADRVGHAFTAVGQELRQQLCFAIAWANSGFPRIAIRRHLHAAMLMWTDTASAAVEEARAPWNAFAIAIPNQLIAFELPDGTTTDITNAFVQLLDSGECWVAAGDDRALHVTFLHPSLPKLGSTRPESRVAEVVARLVLGICLDITEYRPSDYVPGAKLPIKRKRGEPQTNSFVVTRDVDVDCRPAVRDYVARRDSTHKPPAPAAPAAQRMHRGHWQLQVHGKSNSLRKWKFHRPYWQGLEDAPIAVRDHVLGEHD